MSRWEAYAREIEADPTLPEANRKTIAASLRHLVAVQAAQDTIPMTADVGALLGKASRYLLLAERLHTTEPRALLAILLAVCDLEMPKPRKPSGGYTHGKRRDLQNPEQK